MALTFKAVTCVAGEYTRLVYGAPSVAFKLREAGTGRLWGGQIPDDVDHEDEEAMDAWAPEAGIVDYMTYEGKQPFSYNALAVEDGVWFKPDGTGDVIMEVNHS